MRFWRSALLMLAAFFALCGAARAAVGDVSYGAWSEWTDQPIENQTNLFVERRAVRRPVTRRAWRYTRYAVGDGTYAALSSGAPGAQEEKIELDSPLAAAGVQDGRNVYEGGWFNQQALIVCDHLESATQYRAREIFLTACAVEPSALILEVGEHVRLDVELLDPDGAYSLTSDFPEVASVNQQGLLSALSPGRTRVTLIYQGQRAACEVLVVSGREALKEGAAALRLSGTRLTVRYDAGKKSVTGLKLAEEVQGSKADAEMRLLVDGVDADSFSLRALCPRIAYLTAPLSDDGDIAAGTAQISMLKEILDRDREIEKLRAEAAELRAGGAPTAQPEETGEYADFAGEGGAAHRFRALRTTEGDLILCLQADGAYALTAVRAEDGAGLAIEKLNLDDPRQRWTLESEAGDVAGDRVWRLPVADNSFCQITDDFKTMARDGDKHDGVDFSPTANKDVLAVTAGRVVRVDDRCTHDYKKTKLNKYGRYIDPCDVKDGIVSKYGSYGKYVIIEHADGTRSMYAHLSKILVKSGQKVKKGQTIGVMGSTGSSSGIHLHFEVRVSGRAVDPRYFLSLPEIGGYVP